MRAATLFALSALLPAAANATSPLSASAITIPLCTGEGTTRSIVIEGPSSDNPAGEGEHPCPKACHSACSRKRSAGTFPALFANAG